MLKEANDSDRLRIIFKYNASVKYMEVKLERRYSFLRSKYNQLLLPTFFMVMSEKLCIIIDVIIIGFFLGSTQLSVINLAAPITYFIGVSYILFGQGGNLLALRAQSQLNYKKRIFILPFRF